MSRLRSLAGRNSGTVAALLALILTASVLGSYSDALSGILTRRTVDTLKAVLAIGAAAWLWLEATLRGRGRVVLPQRLRNGVLVALAIGAALSWWNFLQFHYPHYIHYSDTYHYFIGSKYFPELGYTRLYDCAAIADARAVPEVARGIGAGDRRVRDLATNRMRTLSEVLEDPAACTDHFGAARWRSFEADVAWFRGEVVPARWIAMHRDHGYNAPPAWGMLGGRLANLVPASDRAVFALSLLDPLFLGLMFACVGWAFGWQVTCIAVVFWGTNLFGVFGWNGGGFLRQTWLAASVIGICCLRKDRSATAGFLLAVAACLRIFPGAVIAAVGVRALWELSRSGSVAPRHRRFGTGCVAALALVASLSALGAGGLGAWRDFVDNSRLHLATPLKNHVGLRTVLSHDGEAVDRLIQGDSAFERYETWEAARSAQFERRRVIYWVALAGFLALLVLAVRNQPDWVAAVLGVGVIPVAFELTNYYYACLLVFGFLWVRWQSSGALLCALAALTWVAADHWQWQDEILTWCSVAVLGLVLYCTERARRDPDPASA